MLVYRNQALEIIFSYQKFMKENIFKTLTLLYLIIFLSGLLIFPTALFEIANGFIYAIIFDGNYIGLFIGFISFMLITSLSAVFTYLFSRALFGTKIKNFLLDSNANKTKNLDIVLKTQPFKLLFLLRLSPLLPTAMFNFLIGAFESNF